MKELFPLKTFQQDAVLKRLEELREGVEDVDDKMPYDEDTDTYSIDGNFSVSGDVSVTGKVNSVWEEDIDLSIKSAWLNGITLLNKYAKLLIKNGVMYIVISLQLKNETESAITTSDSIDVFELSNIKDEIAEKIYRKDGTNLLVGQSNSNNILVKQGYFSTSTGGSVVSKTMTLNSSNAKSMFLYPRDTLSISANSIMNFDFRVFITL